MDFEQNQQKPCSRGEVMAKPLSIYRNSPRGMNRLSTNIKPDSMAVDLDDMAAYGSRAQRRFAKKMIARLEKERATNGHK